MQANSDPERPVAEGWFSGELPQMAPRPGYLVAIVLAALVSLLMVLLYLGLIVAILALVVWWIRHGFLLFGSRIRISLGAVVAMIFLYICPIFSGIVSVIFLAKPLLARRTTRPIYASLGHEEHPVLFHYLGALCQVMGAPIPSRVDVNCAVNASAHFRSGFRSFFENDLVLTIGLPLIAGLDIREFAGVMAHELGHFRQGWGMRASLLIRGINHWFAKAIWERDSWDQWLEESSESDSRFAVLFSFSKLGIALSRIPLRLLLAISDGVSRALSRQQEFDADRCGALVAGSEAYTRTSQAIRLLDVAQVKAYGRQQQLWLERRLIDDFPALVASEAHRLTDSDRTAAMDQLKREQPRWGSHPSDEERNKAVVRLNAPGIVTADGPASALFQDFPALCRAVTLRYYRDERRLPIQETQLAEVNAVIEAHQEATAERDFLAEYCVGFHRPPYRLDFELEWLNPVINREEVKAEFRRLSEEIRSSAAAIQELHGEWSQLQARWVTASAGEVLAMAEVSFEPSQLGMTGKDVATARRMVAWATSELRRVEVELEPYRSAVEMRFRCALQLLADPELAASIPDYEETSNDSKRMLTVLVKVKSTIGYQAEMIRSLLVLDCVSGQARTHADRIALEKPAAKYLRGLEKQSNTVRAELTGVPYPFEHARGKITLNDFCSPESLPVHQRDQAYVKARTQIERLPSVYETCLGRLAAMAGAVEGVL